SASIRDLSRAPAVSVSRVRVSLTARTAIDSGVKGRSRSSSLLNIILLFGWRRFRRRRGLDHADGLDDIGSDDLGLAGDRLGLGLEARGGGRDALDGLLCLV